MTSTGPGDGQGSDGRPEEGPFILRPLLDNVPLVTDETEGEVKINCVEYYDRNLYVGTSASELLHFVQIPPDPKDPGSPPVYILASRLFPNYVEVAGPLPGVQQILLLPHAGKACIRCNWTVTLYSLPELSPAFDSSKVRGCNWIGGVDLNKSLVSDDNGQGPAPVNVLLASNRRIQALEIGSSKPRIIQRIDLPGISLAVRRDSIACVADSKSYSLLDVERQLRIPLMSISSLDESTPPEDVGHAQSLHTSTGVGVGRSSSLIQGRSPVDFHSHARSSSLGGSILGSMRRGDDDARQLQLPSEVSSLDALSSPQPLRSPQPTIDGIATPPSIDKPLPQAPGEADAAAQPSQAREEPRQVFLQPHIASPGPEEFLVIRGTSPVEPCIGMFVNLDGDPTRAPVNFERYPKELVVDTGFHDLADAQPTMTEGDDGFVLVSLTKEFKDGLRHGIEIQSLNSDNDGEAKRYWLEADGVDKETEYGIRPLTGREEFKYEEIVEKLCQKKFRPFSTSTETPTISLRRSDSRTALSIEQLSKEKELFEQNFDSQEEDALPDGWEASRSAESKEFARRLAKAYAGLVVWAGDRIWWAVRNPLILKLDSTLEAAISKDHQVDRRALVSVLGSVRQRDAQSELEFLTFGYLRQKIGLLLLSGLLKSASSQGFSEAEVKAVEEVLVESSLDPRVVLALIPGVRNEIVEGQRGIWIYGGVKGVADSFIQGSEFEKIANGRIESVGPSILQFLRKFLTSWRGMKGLPSVSEESEVFRTVDAALLLVLLELDKNSPKGMGKGGSVRAELNDLVDKGVDCFERAVNLLESYHRLFILSRLYQSRKMAGDVLNTWKRIIEGERDEGQEFRDGELRVREYLSKIRSQSLVQEYGVWLANRNPKLGVQVFAEDKGRAPKFEPVQVVELLKEEAPVAVKYYLEHLVFDKGYTVYVNDLITYYLDVVVSELQSSAESRDAVMATYEAYKALRAPKPTYRHFLSDNAPQDDEVWHSRLRLLQLLSGAHDYDTISIKERIASLPDDLLVPETIILSGRERNHEVAVRLLVHKLGDYDAAVSYCLRGGTSIDSFTTSDGLSRKDSLPSVDTQRRLFNAVLHEFLAISDISDRIEQTGALLERFGGWFEVDDVLKLIPDSWSVDIVAGFLVGALRRLVKQKHESVVTRALSGAENLRISYDLVARVDEKGPSVEAPN
ncbi:unnamed protein product [Clonostachys byssicola]|uniref:CNH domain-containing protein n=1 Tax=Clonostachys byssicola TaxID=160290 RepID=A0A9N9Y807_9HYPO|nr:unnamed protein product [Clonostachys byssicola]